MNGRPLVSLNSVLDHPLLMSKNPHRLQERHREKESKAIRFHLQLIFHTLRDKPIRIH